MSYFIKIYENAKFADWLTEANALAKTRKCAQILYFMRVIVLRERVMNSRQKCQKKWVITPLAKTRKKLAKTRNCIKSNVVVMHHTTHSLRSVNVQ